MQYREEKTKSESTISVGFFSLLTLIFITLKLAGVINWSWWWVLSPLWMPTALIIVILIIAIIVIAVRDIIKNDEK